MKRVLGIDFGEKRIGLAISDPLKMTAQAMPFLENKGNVVAELKKRLDENFYDLEALVVGLPKNREGGDSAKALEVRTFAEQLKAGLGLEPVFWDERFSTVAVTRHLTEAGVRRDKRKTIIDSQAAMFILQGYLDSLGRK